ncbi:hypothetical protein BRARA_H00477 [Brassica rapa]|uniref:Myb-like domain-containing protein n=1 Tax=Brassica campestris TaxID=3711 RepID=A0A397YG99_BRACM|nr:hypothetical protein BRARA_H00477 [Brassica rapa]
MPSSIPNYPSYYGSMMSYLPPRHHISSTSMGNEFVLNIRTTDCPEFSTQIGLGDTSGINEGAQKKNEEDSTHARRKSPKWSTSQKLVLISASCRNHYNYMNKKLSKWVGVYDNAKRKQQSGWSENDVLVKAQEIYSGSKNEYFNLISHENDTSDSNSIGSNSVGSNICPIGRDTSKKR